jgi:hypothetical protein
MKWFRYSDKEKESIGHYAMHALVYAFLTYFEADETGKILFGTLRYKLLPAVLDMKDLNEEATKLLKNAFLDTTNIKGKKLLGILTKLNIALDHSYHNYLKEGAPANSGIVGFVPDGFDFSQFFEDSIAIFRSSL